MECTPPSATTNADLASTRGTSDTRLEEGNAKEPDPIRDRP